MARIYKPARHSGNKAAAPAAETKKAVENTPKEPKKNPKGADGQ